jgi:cytochrome c553
MRGSIFCILALMASGLAGSAPGAVADDRETLFESKIRPVLVGTCFRCHGDLKTSAALRVDSLEALLRGGETGPAIVPGKPQESLLIRAIQRQPDVSAMPPEKQKGLRPDQVADFVSWVQAGAVWPAKSAKFEARKHWAFEPLRDIVPAVKDQAWGKSRLDAFIRAKQEAAGVGPAPAADKLTLIRRATFDLTGLPPTPEEVEAFLRDDSPEAFEAVVERLLQSPAYGEKWGRHWLDVMRYADTAGETADYPVPQAWRYRNYVIEAFNADKPYDEFVREQIAGDILANQGPPEKYAERVTATGYLAISRRFGFDSENYHHLTIQDTIDTLGQSVLGLSLGCARCHDHKFDAVSRQDYYALYGIFDSSRYPFPGSEQKQKIRAMAPLIPLAESLPKWREFESRVAALGADLNRQKRPVPAAVLRSVNDLDGDFELQAPAAGGSNGVLVPPWLYEGKIAVTTAAQSPFKNLFPMGRVGASLAADAGAYRIAQAIHPRRSREDTDSLFVNLDFRVDGEEPAATGVHRFSLGGLSGSPALEILIASKTISLRTGSTVEALGPLPARQWQNLQLTLDLKQRTLSGRYGAPGAVTEFSGKALAPQWAGAIELLVFDSGAERTDARLPAIEYDNLGVQAAEIPAVSTEPAASIIVVNGPDPAVLTEQLQALTGIDGDFELQAAGRPPASPWNPGPNSVVQLAAGSQSPFHNVYGPGTLGIQLPNREQYDGFGLTLPAVKPAANGQLCVGFDFRCASQEHGGNGSWRYYIGHGPGNSAAVELFFNGSAFFRRSGDAREQVAPLKIGQWYQVQLILDLPAKSYTGVLASPAEKIDFSGELASGWDGAIDYSFIDSYGHIGGTRPALDADNFAIDTSTLPPLDAPAKKTAEAENRRTQVAELRRQLTALQGVADREAQELQTLLAEGPVALAYGMAEGTPHPVRIQKRGEPDQLGEEVPRGFLAVLGQSTLPSDAKGSGRLELAQWLTRPDNPLTARVMANRTWQYHFGRGLVMTPNDFGTRGLPPTHPELLDYLAMEFVRSGWSIKTLHRRIMLSATYQQSSEAAETGGTDSPDLYVRFPRRRLSAEEIRDAILAVSGELDRTPGREHPFPSPISWGFSQHGPFSAVYDHNKRSVYLMTQRLKRHPFLALFDGADPNASTANRLETTVPTQALFFLNDPLIHAKAEAWAARLRAACPADEQRVDLAWQQAYGHLPQEAERAEAAQFLAAYRTELTAANKDQVELRALAAYLRTIFASNEFLHVD